MVRVFGISMFVVIAVVAAIVVKNFGQVEVSAKENVAKNIVGGTLLNIPIGFSTKESQKESLWK